MLINEWNNMLFLDFRRCSGVVQNVGIFTLTYAFKTRFLNPSKCSTVTLFQQEQRVNESVQDLITTMRAIDARLGTQEASSTCRASANISFTCNTNFGERSRALALLNSPLIAKLNSGKNNNK